MDRNHRTQNCEKVARKRSFCIRYVPAKMKLNLSSGGMSLDFKDAVVSWENGEEYSEDSIELQSLEFIPMNYGLFSEKLDTLFTVEHPRITIKNETIEVSPIWLSSATLLNTASLSVEELEGI